MFREHLPAIMAGTAPRRKQNLKEGSYLWASFDWSVIDWSRDAAGIRGHIRCFTGTTRPVHTTMGGVTLTVSDAEVADAEAAGRGDAKPGEVLAVTGKGVLVQAGTGQVLLTDFAVDGSRTAALTMLSAGRVPVVLG